MKKTFLAVSVLLTQLAMADGASDKSNQMKPMIQDTGMMNTSARPDLNGTGWYLYGDALCWQAQVDGATWSYAARDGGVDDEALTITNVHTKDVKFKWDWGFRAGVGYNMEYDNWDTQLYYTWFQTDVTERASVPQNTALATNFVEGLEPVYTYAPVYEAAAIYDTSINKSGSINWRIHYSMFDWDLGRAYHVSKNLAFRPSIGIKGGWIYQKMKESTTSFYNATGTFKTIHQTVHQTNDFWGVGPSANLNTCWALTQVDMHMFGLFGDLGGAMMYGNYTNTMKQIDSENGDIRFPSTSRALVTPMLRMMMGFDWHFNFNQDSARFGLKLGYELQYWFTQNQFMTTTHTNFGKALAFQGGTLEARFDF